MFDRVNNIQLITKNEYKAKEIIISSFENYYDLNSFEFNIIDLNSEEMWEERIFNPGRPINLFFKSFKKSSINDEIKVIVLIPQNLFVRTQKFGDGLYLS